MQLGNAASAASVRRAAGPPVKRVSRIPARDSRSNGDDGIAGATREVTSNALMMRQLDSSGPRRLHNQIAQAPDIKFMEVEADRATSIRLIGPATRDAAATANARA